MAHNNRHGAELEATLDHILIHALDHRELSRSDIDLVRSGQASLSLIMRELEREKELRMEAEVHLAEVRAQRLHLAREFRLWLGPLVHEVDRAAEDSYSVAIKTDMSAINVDIPDALRRLQKVSEEQAQNRDAKDVGRLGHAIEDYPSKDADPRKPEHASTQ